MAGRLYFVWILILCVVAIAIPIPVHCEYHTNTEMLHQYGKVAEKVTQLHFYLHDIISGNKPSAVLVAQSNATTGFKSPTPFGSVFATDDPLTEGPEATSTVIGNAQGLYVSSDQNRLSIVMYIDLGFTSGEYNGSSLSVFSRNPVLDGGDREIAVVGGRGKFRMARGFALLKTHYFNVTNGDAVIEYTVTVFHY